MHLKVLLVRWMHEDEALLTSYHAIDVVLRAFFTQLVAEARHAELVAYDVSLAMQNATSYVR